MARCSILLLLLLTACEHLPRYAEPDYSKSHNATVVSVEKFPGGITQNGTVVEPRIDVVVELDNGMSIGMVCMEMTDAMNWNTPYPRCLPLKPGNKVRVVYDAGHWRLSVYQSQPRVEK